MNEILLLNDIREFIFNTQKLHNFIQNYIMTIVQILFKCKSYILHIKTSQI